MSTGWLTVKKGTFWGYPVFEVNHENDGSNLCTLNEAVARQLYDDLGEALGCDRYAEGFADAQAEQYEALKQ